MTEAAPNTFDRTEELSLLTAVLSGDSDAGARFVRRYTGTIEMCVRQVFKRSGFAASEDDIKDMVSEVWLTLLDHNKRSLRRFEPERQIRVATWIGLLARNKAVDRLRMAYDRVIKLGEDGQVPDRASNDPSPPEFLEHERRCKLFESAMTRLKADERQFLEAWYIDGRHPEELAEEFGIALGTVYSRRFKLQQKLARTVRHLTRPRLRSHLPSAAIKHVQRKPKLNSLNRLPTVNKRRF